MRLSLTKCDLNLFLFLILRELHQLFDLSASLGWGEGLSARSGQNCGQTRARGRDATPVRGRRAVPPRLSL